MFRGAPPAYEHSGSPVANARIKWFLGESTSIYAPRDIQSDDTQANIAIRDVLDDLCEQRNSVVRGDKTPEFFKEKRFAFGLSASLGDVLHEALSFIIRASLLRIIEEKLLAHFVDGPASQAYFGAQGWRGWLA